MGLLRWILGVETGHFVYEVGAGFTVLEDFRPRTLGANFLTHSIWERVFAAAGTITAQTTGKM